MAECLRSVQLRAEASACPNSWPGNQARRIAGLAEWQFEAARDRGLIPEPDASRRWSTAAAEQLAGRVTEIVAAVGMEYPIGAGRAAERLARHTCREVRRADAEALAERGQLEVVGEYREWPLYDPRQLDALPAQGAGPGRR